MPKENSDELFDRIKRARDLLDEAVALLKKSGRKKTTPASAPSSTAKTKSISAAPDFSMPIRAFVKKNGSGMNGAKKFVLLVAYFTKGDRTKRASLAEIEKHWNKMTGQNLLGMKFNGIFSLRAREHAWVNTEKTGSYYLRPEWIEIFQ
jgi:hypothetical protein